MEHIVRGIADEWLKGGSNVRDVGGYNAWKQVYGQKAFQKPIPIPQQARQSIAADVGAPAWKAIARGAAGAIAPTAIITAANGYNTPTAAFQQQTGIQNPVGARAAGIMQDLGNNLTMGLAGKLGKRISR